MLDLHQSEEEWEGLELEYSKKSVTSWREMALVPKLKGLGVSILCCQKVVGHGVKKLLENAGITVIDRLGTAGHDRIVRMSGATPISSTEHRCGYITYACF